MAELHSPPSPAVPQPVANNPDPDAIPDEKWVAGEDPILQVLNCVYPTLDSEDKRKDVIEYMQKLFRTSLGVEVFPYGSMPLKTYLPDGDIDFTAIGLPDRGLTMPREVFRLLEYEEHVGNNEFDVKDVTFIDAEVKLVKCIVSGIVVDISFNQLGGLCTLCFLEQVDRHIGNDHIFKRSIILIKTWCFYESRILGANYGLISTYALAVLVLYIFHVFGASLTSPLMALYKFLDYYSKFDWDNYCISLSGLVNKSSLPDIFVEKPINDSTGAFLSDNFMQNCQDMFMLRCKELEDDVPDFMWKFLNIVDPLNETNNLGRSVNQANSYRILSALRYGARTLRQVLEQENENIGDGINKFFVTTMQRHKSKVIPHLPLMLDTLTPSSISEAEYEDDMDSKISYDDLDVYVSRKDDVALVGSGKASDLDVSQDLSLGTIDEVANSGSGHNDVTNNSLVDLRNQDESLNPFANLRGDYDGSLRNLLYGQSYHRYALTASILMETRFRLRAYQMAVAPVRRLSEWFHQSSWFQRSSPSPQVNTNTNTNGVVYRNGQTTTGTSQHYRREERNMVRGNTPYNSAKNFFTGRSRRAPGPAVPNRQHEPARGRSGAQRQAGSQRKLLFGSIGSANSVARSDPQGPSPSYAACGLSQGSDKVENVFFKNDEDFPPLAA